MTQINMKRSAVSRSAERRLSFSGQETIVVVSFFCVVRIPEKKLQNKIQDIV
jgi:hypothetical protein